MLTKYLLFLGLLLATSYSQFSRDDFEACYGACRTNFRTAFIAAGDTSDTTIRDNLYNYEYCVSEISKTKFKDFYTAANEPSDPTTSQKSYCKYFFSEDDIKYDASEVNQSQLELLVKNCFGMQDDANVGCQYTTTSGTSNQSDGTYHYTQSFEQCIQTCIGQTVHEDQQLYTIAVDACESTFTSAKAAVTDSSNDNDEYNSYKACIRNKSECGRLYFFDFTDFQYQTYWKECHDDCITQYNTAIGDSANQYQTARKAYFTCLQAAPIPDADSFTRLDNTVETSSQLLYSSVLLVCVLLSIII